MTTLADRLRGYARKNQSMAAANAMLEAASVIEELESKLDRIQDAYAESVDDELEYNLGNILKGA